MSSSSAKAVLYVVNDLAYFRAHRQALAGAMAKRGYRVFVIAGNCTQKDARKTDPYTLVATNIVRQGFSPAADLKFALFVRRWMTRHRPGIVHMITIKPVLFGTLGLVLPTILRGFRLIWTMPGLGKVYEPESGISHRLRRWLTTKGLRLAAKRGRAVISVENAFDRERLINENIAPPDRVEVIDGTGLDFGHFTPSDRTRGGSLVFFMATRLLKAKGVGTYLAVARQMRANGANARFFLAGLTDPVNPDAFDEHLIEEAASQGVIEWLGPLDQAAMPGTLRQADVFCLPTKLQEGLPRSLMEAAACGCALIAPDQIPIRKFLIDGETGWLIGIADEEHLATAVAAAIEVPEEVQRMGARAAEHIRSLPVSDTDVMQKFVHFYGLGETEQ